MGPIVSYVRFSYLNGELDLSEEPIDLNGKFEHKMGINLQSDRYIIGIYNSSSIENKRQPFTEYPNGGDFGIHKNGQTDIDICITTNNYNVCPSSINNIFDKDNPSVKLPLTRVYFETPLTDCYTYAYRTGSIVTDPISLPGDPTYQKGKLCRLSYNDFKQTIDKQNRCCLASHINMNDIYAQSGSMQAQYQTFSNLSTQKASDAECPLAFSNGFATTHCDVILEDYCTTNPNTDICRMFLSSKIFNKKATLHTFINHCSNNLHDPICQSLSTAAKDMGNSGIVDQMIQNFCDRNLNDKSCACYLTSKSLPSNFKDNYYLGPIACWYKPCAELSEAQFMPYEYYLQRTKCSLTRCTIDVGKVSENPNILELINHCRAKSRDTIIPTIIQSFFDDDIWRPGNLGILTISLLSFIILLSTCLLSFRKLRNK